MDLEIRRNNSQSDKNAASTQEPNDDKCESPLRSDTEGHRRHQQQTPQLENEEHVDLSSRPDVEEPRGSFSASASSTSSVNSSATRESLATGSRLTSKERSLFRGAVVWAKVSKDFHLPAKVLRIQRKTLYRVEFYLLNKKKNVFIHNIFLFEKYCARKMLNRQKSQKLKKQVLSAIRLVECEKRIQLL